MILSETVCFFQVKRLPHLFKCDSPFWYVGFDYVNLLCGTLSRKYLLIQVIVENGSAECCLDKMTELTELFHSAPPSDPSEKINNYLYLRREYNYNCFV